MKRRRTTQQDIEMIRDLSKTDTPTQIAKKTGISHQMVGKIQRKYGMEAVREARWRNRKRRAVVNEGAIFNIDQYAKKYAI